MVVWEYFAEQWSLGHGVVFDGVNKRIYLSVNVPVFDVKRDIYSAWKEWVQLLDNTKYLAAFRTSGGDPVGAGQYTGDVYFLINDWQIVVRHNAVFNGVIYHDNQDLDVFIVESGGGVTSKVSNLSFAYDPVGMQDLADEILTSVDKTLTTSQFLALK